MTDTLPRIIQIIKRMQNGGRYTSNELLDYLLSEGFDTTLRTVQRDLKNLFELNVIFCEDSKAKEQIWKIEKAEINSVKKRKLSTNELMSFYILKSHLKSFKSTMIEEEINTLTRKIEDVAPDEIIMSDTVFWDQVVGSFNYMQYDNIIRRIVHFILNGKWVEIEYNTSGKGKVRKLIVFIYSMFNYNGALYLAAYENKHKSYITLAIQNIDSIEETNSHNKAPNFNYEDFNKSRFAVFVGEIKTVKIKINNDMVRYFENRTWHQSQSFKKDKNGNFILKMEVPIKEDLISWILSWSPNIEVIEPQELIDKIKQRISDSLNIYKK